MQLKRWFWIQIQKIASLIVKNLVWYTGFKWGLKFQLEFYVGPITNLSSSFHMFLNPSRIQILTQFFCGSQFITVAGPTLFFSPIFSLSPPLLLCLSLSNISRPLHRRRQIKKYPIKQKQTEMQETILSLSKKKKKRKKKGEKWSKGSGRGNRGRRSLVLSKSWESDICQQGGQGSYHVCASTQRPQRIAGRRPMKANCCRWIRVRRGLFWK